MITKATRRAGQVTAPGSIRCAVYTRKSVSDKFEKNVTTLEAQRDAGEAYIRSQQAKDWVALPQQYDDDGCTGANMDRPAFRRLLQDVENGQVDIVVIHRFDRLSRSQKDFIWIIDFFTKHSIQFVSVSETIDTSTGIGECMLTMLIAFSQLERRVIAERTKQKILATRKRGHWTGGHTPLGYDLVERRLVVNETEADAVRELFELFLEHQSILGVTREMNDRGHRTKRGRAFDRGRVRTMLQSPVYAGKMRAGDEVVEGEHEAIVDQESWDRVQAALDGSGGAAKPKRKSNRLLAGLLRCARCGSAMTPTHTTKGKTRYSYYTCQKSDKQGVSACPGSRVAAAEIERIVAGQIQRIGENPALARETARAADRQVTLDRDETRARVAALAQQRADLERERRATLDSLTRNGTDTRPLHEALGEISAKLHRVEAEASECQAQLATLEGIDVTDDEVREVLRAFGPVWKELFPAEKAKIAQALLEAVTYAPDSDEVEIEFRPEAVALIGEEER